METTNNITRAIVLVSKGQYPQQKEIRLIKPESLEKLKDEIVNIATGRHCDFDTVKGVVVQYHDYDEYEVSDSEYLQENIDPNDLSESLTFSAIGLDRANEDEIRYNEEEDEFERLIGDGERTNDEEEACKYHTRGDYSRDIQDLRKKYQDKEEKAVMLEYNEDEEE